jgi:hypothetical protein
MTESSRRSFIGIFGQWSHTFSQRALMVLYTEKVAVHCQLEICSTTSRIFRVPGWQIRLTAKFCVTRFDQHREASLFLEELLSFLNTLARLLATKVRNNERTLMLKLNDYARTYIIDSHTIWAASLLWSHQSFALRGWYLELTVTGHGVVDYGGPPFGSLAWFAESVSALSDMHPRDSSKEKATSCTIHSADSRPDHLQIRPLALIASQVPRVSALLAL